MHTPPHNLLPQSVHMHFWSALSVPDGSIEFVLASSVSPLRSSISSNTHVSLSHSPISPSSFSCRCRRLTPQSLTRRLLHVALHSTICFPIYIFFYFVLFVPFSLIPATTLPFLASSSSPSRQRAEKGIRRGRGGGRERANLSSIHDSLLPSRLCEESVVRSPTPEQSYTQVERISLFSLRQCSLLHT